MLSVQEAYDIAQKNNPGMVAYICYEYDEFYTFSMTPAEVPNGAGFVNSSVSAVNKKTGNHKVMHFSELFGLVEIKKINVKTLK